MRVGPLSLWNQYTSFLSSDPPTNPRSSSSTTTSSLAPPVLFGLGTVAGKMPPAMGSREAKEKKRAPLLLLQAPASKAVLEKPIIEEK